MHYSKILLSAMMAGALALTGCGGSDDDPVFITVNSSGGAGGSGGSGGTDGGTGGGTNTGACGDIGEPNGTTTIDGTAVTLCRLPSSITEDTTLTPEIDGAPVAWNLDDQRTFVGNGQLNIADASDVDSVILTIEPGTHFRSSGKGSLVITRGSQILAQGTESDPIVMSSIDDNFDGRGEWGGLVLMGFGDHNNCPPDPEQCNILGEGGVGFFGGEDNGDNSGVLEYVIVAEGGFELSPGNEINGIGFYAVGDGTTVENIQVHNNSDDGVEFYSGTVNVRNLVLTGNSDDSIDWDEGFQGNIQYAVVTHSDEGDHGMETDNAGPADDADPQSKPTLANITLVGNAGVSDTGIIHKVGSGGFLYNSIVSNFDNCLDVDSAHSNSIIGTELVYRQVIFNCTADGVGDGDGFEENLIADGSSVIYSTVGGSSASGGVITGDLDSATLAWDTPAEADSTATGGAQAFTQADTADLTFLDQTDYIGAVDPNSPTAWWDAWALSGTVVVAP